MSQWQATFAATLFDEWCRAGLRDVVVCPGSRSTPLALAAAHRDELAVHVRIDERSAAFFALGRALVTKRPVALVVTSGTAAAEVHAAVAEADLAQVPLLVVTADRPPELHGVGAPQTIRQHSLYGPMVRRFEEPGVARGEAATSWRPLASRLWLAAEGMDSSSGPVHLNAAFVEPLLAEPLPLPPGRTTGRAWRTWTGREASDVVLDLAGQRVLAVVGAGVGEATLAECHALDWVVLGDATARGSLAYFDALLRDERFVARVRPDVVVRLGGLPASRVLQDQLRAWGARTVSMGPRRVADPDSQVAETVEGLPRREHTSLRADPAYARYWRTASRRVGEWLDGLEAEDAELTEPMVARLVAQVSSRHRVPLMVGSSMPVRDVEWWAPARTNAIFSNRGANGIDGVVSTALGIAASGRAVGLVGDVTLLHDVSGLVDGLGSAGGSCVLVVVNNRGGGIFSFLSQARQLATDRFEELFATPRPHDLEAVARAFGHESTSVKSGRDLARAIDDGLAVAGLTVVVANVPSREENVDRHEALNRAVRDHWSVG